MDEPNYFTLATSDENDYYDEVWTDGAVNIRPDERKIRHKISQGIRTINNESIDIRKLSNINKNK